MSFKQTKFYFENLFSVEWTKTPVHFAGMEFDKKKKTAGEWINLTYKPSYLKSQGLDSGIQSGMVTVVCWAETDVDSMGLSDDVVSFFNMNIDTKFRVRSIDVIDHGWQTATSAYTMLSFRFEYNIGC